MNSRTFTFLGTLYVSFAIFCAATSSYQGSTTVGRNNNQGAVVGPCDSTVQPSVGVVWRTTTYSPTARIVVWGTPECYGCNSFKEKQVPIIKDAGVDIVIKNAREETPPEGVEQYPTIIIYDGDTEIERFVGDTPAEKVLASVPEKEEAPPEYRIWDIRRWLKFLGSPQPSQLCRRLYLKA